MNGYSKKLYGVNHQIITIIRCNGLNVVLRYEDKVGHFISKQRYVDLLSFFEVIVDLKHLGFYYRACMFLIFFFENWYRIENSVALSFNWNFYKDPSISINSDTMTLLSCIFFLPAMEGNQKSFEELHNVRFKINSC